MPIYQGPYGQSKMIVSSVLDAEDSPAGLTLEVGMTFAAGDLTAMTSHQAPTALTAELVAFTSGSVRPAKGDQISGATSSQTATVIDTIITSGSWSGGDAAGFIFAESVSGAFQAENLDNDTSGQTNFATIGADFTAGVGAVVASKSIAYALTASEMECEWAQVEIVDQTATEVWLEEDERIETYGHPNAMHQPEGNAIVLSDGVLGTNTSATIVHLQSLPSVADDDYNDYLVVFKDVNTGAYHSEWIADWTHSTKLATLANALPFTPADDIDLYWVLSVRRDTAPSDLSAASTDISDAVDASSVVSNYFGDLISDSVNDASATATGFTVTTSVGADVRVGILRLTSGALSGEARLVSWTGTTVAVLSDSSMPTALKQFSAAPANSVTFTFRPL